MFLFGCLTLVIDGRRQSMGGFRLHVIGRRRRMFDRFGGQRLLGRLTLVVDGCRQSGRGLGLYVIRRHRDGMDRDYLFLSKGHDVPALYGTFVEMGLLAPERLANHLSTNDSIYWHPNRNIPGVEFHSGSLGHLPSVAAGVALDCKLRGGDNRIVVITGDGELNEGSVWETILVANAHGLDVRPA